MRSGLFLLVRSASRHACAGLVGLDARGKCAAATQASGALDDLSHGHVVECDCATRVLEGQTIRYPPRETGRWDLNLAVI
jgi:hypothetical protein